jgi:hypothetical protein
VPMVRSRMLSASVRAEGFVDNGSGKKPIVARTRLVLAPPALPLTLARRVLRRCGRRWPRHVASPTRETTVISASTLIATTLPIPIIAVAVLASVAVTCRRWGRQDHATAGSVPGGSPDRGNQGWSVGRGYVVRHSVERLVGA